MGRNGLNSPHSQSEKILKTGFFLALVLCLGLGAAFYMLFRGNAHGEVREILIGRGSTLAHVSQVLYQNEVIQNPTLFKILLRVTGGSSKVRAGEFRFKTHMNALSALSVLYTGEPIVHQVTIPEGWNARQIADALSAVKLADPRRFLELTLSRAAAAKYKLNTPSLEGFLYPDTYAFSRVDGEERIVDRMVQQFFQHYNKELKADAEAQGMPIEHLVTLASIIEKETGNANERELVSSVFHNRLRKRMRLQSDPTTIYGIPGFNGNLTKEDLKRYSPYNTYVINGLPPGPIASPGLATLKATLHPADSDYLYFVSDNKGSHIFSKTYGEHSRHVTGYQVAPFKRTSKRKLHGKKSHKSH